VQDISASDHRIRKSIDQSLSSDSRAWIERYPKAIVEGAKECARRIDKIETERREERESIEGLRSRRSKSVE